MDFQKKNWQFRDIISEDELNRMEDGIEEGITKAEQAHQQIDAVNDEIEAINNKLDTQDVRDITVSDRLSIVHTDQATPLHITKLEGRTVVNHLPLFSSGLWSIHENAEVQGDTKLVHTSTSDTWENNSITIKVKPNTSYFMTIKGTGSVRIDLLDADRVVIATPWNNRISATNGKFPFTTTSDTTHVFVTLFTPQEVGEFEFEEAMLSEGSVEREFVAGMKNLSGFYLKRYGKNILPPFNEWTISSYSHSQTDLLSSYELKFTRNTAGGIVTIATIEIPIMPNTTYTLNVDTPDGVGKIVYQVFDAQGNELANNASTTHPKVFTTEHNAAYVRIRVQDNGDARTTTLKNPVLNLGSEPIPFEPQNSDYLYADVELASNANAKDVLEYRDGRYWKVKRFNQVVLDGSLDWRRTGTFAGWRVIAVPKENGVALDRLYGVLPNVVRYDGLSLIPGALSTDGANVVGSGIWNDPDNLIDSLGISIADEDSGWVVGIDPNPNAVKALMNGWRATANAGTVYTAWESILNPAVTQIDETYVASHKAPGWTGWATLQYQVADSVVEDVTDKVEGAISLHDGDNLVEMGEAVVVREDATPSQSSTGEFWIINDTSSLHAASALRYPVEDFVAVYRNGQQDSSWEKFTGPNTNGKWKLRILSNLYDPSSSYSVTYIAEPYQYSTNAQSVDVQYTANVKTALDRNIQDVADLSTRVSTFPSIYARKHQEKWIEPTLLNGWTYSGSTRRVRYYKDEFGIVRVTGRITGGITATGVLLFRLPPGYRPANRTGVPAITWNTSTDTKAVVIDIDTDGSVLLAHTTMSWLEVSFTFRAEQ